MSTKPKFTPGPWSLRPFKHSGYRDSESSSSIRGSDGQLVVIQVLNYDARLIAAAPEMYEVLLAMLNHMEYRDKNATTPEERAYWSECKTMDELKELLSKINGGES